MRGEDAFLTVAEFGIALAGFTSVVVVFTRRGGEWAPVDRFRIENALTGSLGAGMLGLLPSALGLLGVTGPLVWRLASGVLLLYGAITTLRASRAFAKLDAASRVVLGRIVPRALRAGSALVIALQLANCLGRGFEPQPGLFFVGLFFHLLVAVVGFTRTIFLRPG